MMWDSNETFIEIMVMSEILLPLLTLTYNFWRVTFRVEGFLVRTSDPLWLRTFVLVRKNLILQKPWGEVSSHHILHTTPHRLGISKAP